MRKFLGLPVVAFALVLATLSVTPPAPAAPVDVAFDMVTTGSDHTCALANGYVWCWGANEDGQLGTPTRDPVVGTPVAVAGISTAVEIAAGSRHTCARLEDGTARCWGANNVGQLGDGTTVARTTPVEVAGLDGLTGITAGRAHTCAVAGTPSAVHCWGSNGDGQLGSGSVRDGGMELNAADASGQMNGANSVAVDPSGDVLVSDTIGRTVRRFDSAGQLLQQWGHVLDRDNPLNQTPKYAAFAGGTPYVSVGERVYRLAATGAVELVGSYPSTVRGLEGDETGALYVAYHVQNAVTVLKTGADGWTRTFNPGTGISNVTDIALERADGIGARRLYIATATNDFRVKFLSAVTGAAQGSVVTLLPADNPCSHYPSEEATVPQPNAGSRIAVSADGELLVSPQGITKTIPVGGCLNSYDRQGSYIDSFQPGTFSNWRWSSLLANDIASTPDGGAVIVDVSSSRVRRLTALAPTWVRDTTWGTVPFSLEPRPVRALQAVWPGSEPTQIAAGGENSCAIASLALSVPPVLLCWGSNAADQLGGPLASSSWPRIVDLNVADVGVGANHWCAIAVGGASLNCGGVNTSGQLGGGGFTTTRNTVTRNTPTGDPMQFADVSPGSLHTCATSVDGYVSCWGDPSEWGDERDNQWPGWVRTSDDSVSADPEEEFGLLVGAAQISASSRHTCVLHDNGGVYCWGPNPDAMKNIIDRDALTGRADRIELDVEDRLSVVAPAALDEPFSLDFGSLVDGVSGDRVVVTAPAGVPTPSVTLRCRSADGSEVTCSSASSWLVDLVPAEPWLLGATYSVEVNPAGVPPVTLAGLPLPNWRGPLPVPSKQQEDVAGGRYSWPEKLVRVRRARGGDFTWSRTPGAAATYRFRGPAIAWTTLLGPGEGRVAVSVDGGRRRIFDNRADKVKRMHVRKLSGYGKGWHDLRIEVLPAGGDRPAAAGRVVIDAFTTRWGTDVSPELEYTWGAAAHPAADGGTYAWSADPGGTFTLPFWGDAVALHTLAGPAQGDLRIRVDGQPTTFETWADAEGLVPQVAVVDGLPPGPHTLVVEVLGSGPGRRVVLDAIEAGGDL